MQYLIIGLGLFFLALAFILNQKNARFLLAGYNTMSEEERQHFDIRSYLRIFRRFHIFMAISFVLFGLAFLSVMGENAAGIFLGVYPILAYLWFLVKSRQYQSSKYVASNKWAIGVLLFTLLGVLILFAYGFRDNELSLQGDQLVLSGMYGLELRKDQIESLEEIAYLPPIQKRLNGFSSGDVHRGFYRTDAGEKVRLLINSAQVPILLIRPKSRPTIYYAPANEAGPEPSWQALYNWLLEDSA